SATASTWSAGTNKNCASGSTNFLISQGQATRSTFTRSRVIHFIVVSFHHLRGIWIGTHWPTAGGFAYTSARRLPLRAPSAGFRAVQAAQTPPNACASVQQDG